MHTCMNKCAHCIVNVAISISVCMYVHVYSHRCVQARGRHYLSFLHHSPHCLFVRQILSLNLKFIDLARLAGWLMNIRDPPFSTTILLQCRVRVIGHHYQLFTWVLGIQTQVFMLMQKAYMFLTEPSLQSQVCIHLQLLGWC